MRTTRTPVTSVPQALGLATVKTAQVAQLVGRELFKALRAAADVTLASVVGGADGGALGAGSGGRGGGGPSLQGPVGLITNAVTLAGAGDPQLFAIFIATISLNVAVFNTLPVPGLDGGQMAFLAIDALAETVGRPRLDRRVKEGVGVVFALALTGLALSVLLSDMGHVVDGLLGKR